MVTRNAFLIFVIIATACLVPGAHAGTVYTNRATMQVAFGYLQDVYFYLSGTGSPGNYYQFPSAFLYQPQVANYPEFLVNPFIYADQYLYAYGLYSSGNTLLAASFGGVYTNFFQVGRVGPTDITAFGFYVDTAPLSTPAVGESMQWAFDNYLRGTSNVDSGAFIGATGIQGNVYDMFVRWTGAHGVAGEFMAVNHMISAPGYFGAGGDPHLLANGVHSEMSLARPGDIFQMVSHPEVEVNAEIRTFEFLPLSMQENNYFGRVAIQLANGDRLLISAFEEAGEPRFSVNLNDVFLESESSVLGRGYEVRYGQFHNMPGSGTQTRKSFFDREFPYQTHEAIVRIHVPRTIVIDVSLSHKDAFVGWKQPDMPIYRSKGAFLNVNSRDLVQPSHTAGLLARVAEIHAEATRLEEAVHHVEEVIAGNAPMRADVDRSAVQLLEALEQHRTTLANFDKQSRVDAMVTSHKVDFIFSA